MLTADKTGAGLTIIAKVIEGPVQPFKTGLEDTEPVSAVVPPFSPVKEAMLPEPPAARPIEGSELVQFTFAPTGVLVKLMAEVLLFTQIVDLFSFK